MIKIAVDCNLGHKRVKQLNETFEVVVIAKSAESDQDWLARAKKMNARYVVSKDMDIPKLLEVNQYNAIRWVEYPSTEDLVSDVKYIKSSILDKELAGKKVYNGKFLVRY